MKTISKILALAFAVMMLCSIIPMNAAAAEDVTYAKYSGALTEGDYLIVYEGRAMKAAVSSGRLSYADVTVTDDTITNPDASIVWHIAQSGSNWTIYNESVSQYAASTGVKNKAQLLSNGTDNMSLWTVTGDSTYEFVNVQNNTNGVNKNLRNNTTYGFACYATSTGGALSLYKLSESTGGDTPATCEHEYEFECSTVCKLCDEETRPEAECSPVGDLCQDSECEYCGEIVAGLGHAYDNAYDADCNYCGEVREVEDAPAASEETLSIIANKGVLSANSLSISWSGEYFTYLCEKDASTTAIRTEAVVLKCELHSPFTTNRLDKLLIR